jgi:hypothetical protein
MPAARYTAMFRAAGIVYLLLGLAGVWRFGLTDYDPRNRLTGIALGGLAIGIGVFLFRRARIAIGLSAIGEAFVAISAAIAAPIMHGPVILAFALFALLSGTYAALAGRELLKHD